MAATSFKQVELFGGAMTVNVPSGFADTSDIRQVPDHQEVYLSVTGFISLIFDLGERVPHLETNKEALEYHFDDIVHEDDTKKIWMTNDGMELTHFPNTEVLSLLATTKPPLSSAEQPPRANSPTHTTILMTLIRLGPQSTDMSITLNIPHIPGGPEAALEEGGDIDYEKGKYGPVVEEGKSIMDEVGKTLIVKDWGLFGQS